MLYRSSSSNAARPVTPGRELSQSLLYGFETRSQNTRVDHNLLEN
jgi:hypothetical protein